MNLPEITQVISDTIKSAQQLWNLVGLPHDDVEERRASFYQQLSEVCAEYQKQQQAYIEFVEQQTNALITLVMQLQEKLGKPLYQQSAHVQQWLLVQELSALQVELETEFEQRVSAAFELLTNIQQLSSTCGIDFPPEACEVFGCDVSQLEQVVRDKCANDDQLGKLRIINQQVQQRTKAMFSRAKQLREDLIGSLGRLGRAGLEVYCAQTLQGEDLATTAIVNEQYQGVLTEKQLEILKQYINGEPQPKYNGFIEKFHAQLKIEENDRIEHLQAIKQQFDSLQRIQQIVKEQVGDIEAPELWFEDFEIKSDVSDQYFATIEQQCNALDQLNGPRLSAFVGVLIRQKYVLLSQLSSKFSKSAQVTVKSILAQPEKFAFADNQSKALELDCEISQITDLLMDFPGIRRAVDAFAATKEAEVELQQIQQDKTRYTSKSREALQKRKREELIKHDLQLGYPRVLAHLKHKITELEGKLQRIQINLNDQDVFWSSQAGEPFQIRSKDLLGMDYVEEVHKVLAIQDKAFGERFQQQLKALNQMEQMKETAVITSPTAHSIAIVKTPAIQRAAAKMKTEGRKDMMGSSKVARSVVRSRVEMTPLKK